MFSVTYFHPKFLALHVITTPNELIAYDVADGLNRIGYIARVWNPKKELIS